MKKKISKSLPYIFCVLGSALIIALWLISDNPTIKSYGDFLFWLRGVGLGINVVAVTWSFVSE